MTVDEEAVGDLRTIGGVRIAAMRGADAIAWLAARRDAGVSTELFFANAHFVMQCHGFADRLRRPDTLILNDGIGIDLASRWLHGSAFPENLNGTDFTPRLLASLDRPTRVFLLGARPEAVAETARRWSRLRHVDVVGAVDGYDGMADPGALERRLAEARPDILFVALGDPRQARWIVEHRGRHAVPLVVAVGALFDFSSGSIPRAPALLRRLRVEWIYRLSREPRRLARRYSIDLARFFLHCRRYARAERRLAGAATAGR